MQRSLFVLLFLVLSSFRMQQSSENEKLVMKAAEGQLPVYISKIRADDDNLYGFTLEDDMDLCEVGKPYRLLVFNMDYFDSTKTEDKNSITIKNEWRVPVMIKGVFRNLLTVGGTSGNFVVTNMGDTTLAKDLQKKSKGVDQNDTYYVLRIQQLNADFFVHEATGSFNEAQFIPLESAITNIAALNKTHQQFYTLNEVEDIVKQAITKDPGMSSPSKKPTDKTKADNKKKSSQ